jgi:hypothetical protein
MLVGLFIGLLATTAMVASNILPAVYAVKGGIPNIEPGGPAELNANERHQDKNQKLGVIFDDNPHNDNGPTQAHDNMHDNTGVTCDDC